MQPGVQIVFQPTQTDFIDAINFPLANICYDAGITEHRVYPMEYVYGCVVLWFVMNISMMTSSNGNIFRVTGHLCGEFTVNR